MTREELEIILSKIAQIKENEQKVYDAGRDKGYAEGYAEGYAKGLNDGRPIIKNIIDTSYRIIFERGMTWVTWADSEYYEIGVFTIQEGKVSCQSMGWVVDENGDPVAATSIIDENINYRVQWNY